MFTGNCHVHLKDSFSFKMVLILIPFKEVALESWIYVFISFYLYIMFFYKSMRNCFKDFKKH